MRTSMSFWCGLLSIAVAACGDGDAQPEQGAAGASAERDAEQVGEHSQALQARNYQFTLQTATGLHETPAGFSFDVRSNGDLFAIKRADTGTGSTEVHVLSAGSRYQQFSLHTGTALHETPDGFDFAVAANGDLFAIKRVGTETNSTEVHVLSAASKYQQFSLQTGTALHETPDGFDFALGPNNDLYAIKRTGTGTNSTEVHVLSAASNYQQFSRHTGTALHETPSGFDFDVAANGDLYAIKREGTGTGSTEVHILSAASSYRQFVVQTGTPLHETPSGFDFALGPLNDVFAIKRVDTGSASTELHVLRR